MGCSSAKERTVLAEVFDAVGRLIGGPLGLGA